MTKDMKAINYNDLKDVNQLFFKVGELENVTYGQIQSIFGQPEIILEENSDGKTTVQWYIETDDTYFIIYDWNIKGDGDVSNTILKTNTWSIGGNADPFELIKYINYKTK